eukprot:3039072-Pyramimonas_sp.AAC.1
MRTLTPLPCRCPPRRAHAQSRVHPGHFPHWFTVDFNQTDAPSTDAAGVKPTPQLEGQLESARRGIVGLKEPNTTTTAIAH